MHAFQHSLFLCILTRNRNLLIFASSGESFRNWLSAFVSSPLRPGIRSAQLWFSSTSDAAVLLLFQIDLIAAVAIVNYTLLTHTHAHSCPMRNVCKCLAFAWLDSVHKTGSHQEPRQCSQSHTHIHSKFKLAISVVTMSHAPNLFSDFFLKEIRKPKTIIVLCVSIIAKWYVFFLWVRSTSKTNIHCQHI